MRCICCCPVVPVVSVCLFSSLFHLSTMSADADSLSMRSHEDAQPLVSCHCSQHIPVFHEHGGASLPQTKNAYLANRTEKADDYHDNGSLAADSVLSRTCVRTREACGNSRSTHGWCNVQRLESQALVEKVRLQWPRSIRMHRR